MISCGSPSSCRHCRFCSAGSCSSVPITASSISCWSQRWGFRPPPFDIYTFWGIVFAHLASRSISAKYIFLAPAFRNIDATLEEASHVIGTSSLGTVRRIILPMLLPAILITVAISLIHALESFEIELILGPPSNFYVFSTKMYQLMRNAPPLFGEATVLGLAILIAMLPLILWQQRLLQTRHYVTVTSAFQQRLIRLRRWRWPAFGVIALLGTIVTVVPVICLILGTFMNIFGRFDLAQVWTLDHWREVLSDPLLQRALWNTLIIGTARRVPWHAVVRARRLSVGAYALWRATAARFHHLAAGEPARRDFGLGLLWMFLTVPFFRPLYGTIAVLVIAVLINAVTTGVQLIKSNLVQLGGEFEEASFVVGASWAYTFRRIVLPLLGPVLIAVALYIFNAAARNVATIVMIATGGNRPLALLQVDYMSDGQYESAAIVGIIIVVMTWGAAMLARSLGRRFGFRTL